MNYSYDVIVAGAGPAGSTAASYLAKSGHSVLLVDQCAFPRYAVGESMWVATMDLLKMLGVELDMQEANFVKKIGSTFFWGDVNAPWPVHFIETDNSLRFAYHVDRMKFDQILVNHAKKLGAKISLSTRLKGVNQGKDFVDVHLHSHKSKTVLRSKFFIDATGASSILGKNQTKDVIERPSSLSVWSYFENATTLLPPNNTNGLTFKFKQGWIWIFPIRPNYFSIGVNVDQSFADNFSSGNKLQMVFQTAFDQCPEAQQFMKFAQQVEKFKACVFSPRNLKKYYNKRVLTIGDAACFIDPILSTGIHLGMLGACYAARAINTIKAGGNQHQVLDAFDRFYRQDYTEMRKLTDDLIAMNSHFTDSFWQNRIALKNLSPTSLRNLRRNQCLELSNEQNMDKQITMQGMHVQQMHLNFGLGKYLKINASNQILVSNFDSLNCDVDYQKGTNNSSCFKLATVYRVSKSKIYLLTEIDLFILSESSDKNFQSFIEILRNSFEVGHVSDDELKMRIGLWIERKVLKLKRQTQ